MGSRSDFLGRIYFCAALEGFRERERTFQHFTMLAFPNFYGRKYKNASYFLDDLEMALLASRRDENEIKLKAFPLVLKDEAKIWFQGLPMAFLWPRKGIGTHSKRPFQQSTSLTTALRNSGKS